VRFAGADRPKSCFRQESEVNVGLFSSSPAAYEINQQGEQAMTTPEPNPNAQNAVRYKTVRVEDQDIFYREGGADYPRFGQSSAPGNKSRRRT
jgi:hypothetical protein